MPIETPLFPITLAWISIGVLIAGVAVLVVRQRRTITVLRRHGGQLEQQIQERAAQAERDLAERHQALESLRESEEKYRTLADFTYDWEYWIDPDGRYLYVSPACERITGYRPDEFMANPDLLLNLVHPEDRDRVATHHFGDRKPHEILDFRLSARNGKLLWIGHVCQAVHGSDGRYLGQRGSNRDITARKQAEMALRISEERYRRIVETAHEGIWAVDDEQRTTFVNWRMMDLLGYTPEEMFGQQFESFLFAEDLDEHRAQRERRVRGENAVYERRFRRKDGQALWTAVSAVALRDPDGKVTGAFAMLTDITERKRVEEALRESETLLKDVLDSLTAHIAVLDAQGQILLVNDAWRRFAERNGGLDRLVGIGANYFTACQNAVDRDRDALAQAALRGLRAVMNGEQAGFELEYPCDAPTESRWFAMRVHALTGARPGVVVAHEDITERRRAEEGLRERIELQEQLAKINATVPGVICAFRLRPDGSACFPYASPAIEDLYACTPDAVAVDATPIFKLIHPDDLRHVNETIAESARTLSPWRDEFRIRHPRKGERWIEGHSMPQVEPDGGILWHGFVSDITDRKRVEQALRVALVKYQTLFECFPLGITVADATGLIREVNPMTERLLGISQAEHQQRRIDDPGWRPVRPDGTPMPVAEYPLVRALRQNCLVENGELGFIRESGEMIWLNVTAAPLPVEGYGAVATYGDITARRRMEETLRASLEEKETLLREVHHRVKNNLATISGLLDLQRNTANGAILSSVLDELSNRIRSMALVHEMLYQSDHLNRIDFHRYLQALVGHLRRSFDPCGAVRVEVAAAGVWMNPDITIPCGLIVNELVINAFKHAFPEGRTYPEGEDCHINVAASQENEVNYLLVVADNGVGLPDDLDWTTTRSLGLRLVRMLGQHQIRGSFELDRSGGTRFSLRFDARQPNRNAHHNDPRNDPDRRG
jgi:PAS domain S-box-containing protein